MYNVYKNRGGDVCRAIRSVGVGNQSVNPPDLYANMCRNWNDAWLMDSYQQGGDKPQTKYARQPKGGDALWAKIWTENGRQPRVLKRR